jgi:hypothetical protein
MSKKKRRKPPRSSAPSPRSPEASEEVIDAEFQVIEGAPPGSPSPPPSDVRVVPQAEPESAEPVAALSCMTCGGPGAALVSIVGPVALPVCPRCERIGRLAAGILGVR